MKIKLTCTKKEKEQWENNPEQLQETVCNLHLYCPRGLRGGCSECVEKTVEWDILPEGSDT